MDRLAAQRILGLPESASDDERRAAWWTLHAHVAARVLTVHSPEQRALREHELRDLEEMWGELGLASPPSAPQRERWLLAWAAIASLAALGLGVALLGGDAGPRVLIEGGQTTGSLSDGVVAEAGADRDRARVVANARIDGARIEIEDTGDGVVVASGPADESAYWLLPGRYALRVGHPDCGEAWQHALEAASGGEYLLAPEVCGDTAWLVVQSNIQGARVEVDGQALGTTGPARHALEPGERVVRVAKAGFQRWEGIVELESGRELKLKPRLTPAAPEEPARSAPSAPAVAAARALPEPPAGDSVDSVDAIDAEQNPELVAGWHHDTRHWLLARYDTDRSGRIDTAAELDAISCDYWKGIERSYDASRLGLPLTRMYGFDGNGWKPDSLGIGSAIRDLAFQRLRRCGLRY